MTTQRTKIRPQVEQSPMFGVERLGATGPFAALMREVDKVATLRQFAADAMRGASQGGQS